MLSMILCPAKRLFIFKESDGFPPIEKIQFGFD